MDELPNGSPPNSYIDEPPELSLFVQDVLNGIKRENLVIRYSIDGIPLEDENLNENAELSYSDKQKMKINQHRRNKTSSSIIERSLHQPKIKNEAQGNTSKSISKKKMKQFLNRMNQSNSSKSKIETQDKSPHSLSKEEKINIRKANKAYENNLMSFIQNSFKIDGTLKEQMSLDELEHCLGNLGVLFYPKPDSKTNFRQTHIDDFPCLKAEAENWESTDQKGVFITSKVIESICNVFKKKQSSEFNKIIHKSVTYSLMNSKHSLVTETKHDIKVEAPKSHYTHKVDQQFISFLETVITEKEMLTKKELIVLLKKLGLISNSIDEKNSIVSAMIDQWKEGDDKYIASKIKDTIIESFKDEELTKSQKEIRTRILVARANGILTSKKEKKEPKESKPKVTLSMQRLEELSRPTNPSPRRKIEEIKRPKFVQNPPKPQEFRGISKRSQEILNSMGDISSMEFVSREEEYESLRRSKIDSILQSYEEDKTVLKHSKMSKKKEEELRKRSEQHRIRRQKKLIEETLYSFRPKINGPVKFVEFFQTDAK